MPQHLLGRMGCKHAIPAHDELCLRTTAMPRRSACCCCLDLAEPRPAFVSQMWQVARRACTDGCVVSQCAPAAVRLGCRRGGELRPYRAIRARPADRGRPRSTSLGEHVRTVTLAMTLICASSAATHLPSSVTSAPSIHSGWSSGASSTTTSSSCTVQGLIHQFR